MIGWYALLWGNVAEYSFLLVIVAAHALASSAFLLSDEFPQIKVAVRAVFFNKLLAAAVLSNSTRDGTLLDSLAYEHTCTLGLFKASRKNPKLKNIERSHLDGHSVRRQA